MRGGLAARTKAPRTVAIQHRIDTLNERYANGEINSNELLEGLTYVVTKNTLAKKKKGHFYILSN